MPEFVSAVGQRLGRYHITQEIGAGGMGVVYRARDERLERDVGIKVLRPGSIADERSRSRFRNEARALSRLNHPNIEVIHDFDTENGVDFLVMELVPGASLSDRIRAGPLPEKDVARFGSQLAQGLAAAHEAGVVHSDLKPANVHITPDGVVKLLDFGLAKLLRIGDLDLTATLSQSGAIEGTVPYMAPEQLQGGRIDVRTDIYAAGAVLYEMATARRPYDQGSVSALINAILQTEPIPPRSLNPQLSPVLEYIILKALDKDPDRRYQSARELRVDLERLMTPSTAERLVVPLRAPEVRHGRAGRLRSWRTLWVSALLLIGLGIGWLIYRRQDSGPDFSRAEFHRLTFNRGAVDEARCIGDCDTVAYQARWNGEPPQIYLTRTDQPQSRPIGLKGRLVAASPSGELGVLHDLSELSLTGTLATVPVLGGVPRDLLGNVRWADWSPDGKSIAVDHCLLPPSGVGEDADAESQCRLEYPVGQVLFAPSTGFISHIRVSPKGDRIAFFNHPMPGDDLGSLVISDLAGNRKTLSEGWVSIWGLAWAPDGDRLWFTASEATEHGSRPRALYVVDMFGKQKMALRESGQLTLHDVARNGRILLSRDTQSTEVSQHYQDGRRRDLTLQDFSKPIGISRDGSLLLMELQGEASANLDDVYIRRLGDGTVLHLGAGYPNAISPDNKFVLVTRPCKPAANENAQLYQVPIGPGDTKQITHDDIARESGATYWPDGKRVMFNGSAPGHRIRTWIQDIDGGTARPITPEGIVAMTEVSPDSKWFVAQGPDQDFWLYSDTGQHRPLPALHPGEIALRWGNDSKSVFIATREGLLTAKIFRVNVATGQRDSLFTISPNDPAGAYLDSFVIAPDASFYVSCYMHSLADLFLVNATRQQ